MQIIHLANTCFEFELAHSQDPSSQNLLDLLQYSPYCLQLQYLPLLYAEKGEDIAVTHLPTENYLAELIDFGLWKKSDLPRFVLLDHPKRESEALCLSWGSSWNVKKWAALHEIKYEWPHWDIVKEVNSKAFSFSLNSPFSGSKLIHDEKELQDWLGEVQWNGVLKTCYGVAGRGHLIIDQQISIERIHQFCQNEWTCQRPLLGEKWLNRLFDFSTQWTITPLQEIYLEGSTVFKSDSKGVYKGTLSGPEKEIFNDFLPLLNEHKLNVLPALKKVAKMGYFGAIGVDAFVYLSDSGNRELRSLVEINARKTLSYAALKFQKKWFPERIIKVAFEPIKSASVSLLPLQLNSKKFKQKLTFSHLG